MEKVSGISLEQYLKNKEEFIVLDIREKCRFDIHCIENSICVDREFLFSGFNFDANKKYLIVSQTGKTASVLARKLQDKGLNCFYLSGGFLAYYKFLYEEDLEKRDNIEISIRKKFHKNVFSKFTKAINTYNLVEENDKIAVCISGGKDSMILAKCFQELKRHNKFNFELVFLVMDPGYNKVNKELIETNSKILNIPITMFESDIFENVVNIEKSPCYVCARMRRGYLYSKAKELGCNKIALGHHFDDVIETILMGMLYGAQIQTMMPKLKSKNFEGMELIRPLYLVKEEDIIHWRDYNKLEFLQCACKFTEELNQNVDNVSSKRAEVKEIIKNLKKNEPQIEYNIFKSVENVSLSTIIEYKDKNNIRHNFLDDYDN